MRRRICFFAALVQTILITGAFWLFRANESGSIVSVNRSKSWHLWKRNSESRSEQPVGAPVDQFVGCRDHAGITVARKNSLGLYLTFFKNAVGSCTFHVVRHLHCVRAAALPQIDQFYSTVGMSV